MAEENACDFHDDHNKLILAHSQNLVSLQNDTKSLRDHAHSTANTLQTILGKIEEIKEEIGIIPIQNGNNNTIQFQRNEFHQTTYKQLNKLSEHINTHNYEDIKKKKNWKMMGVIIAQTAALLGILYTLIQIINYLHSLNK